MEKIFFDNWDSLLRTLIISILAYIAVIVLLRISGKRTLSKMNAFDFIVTVALGSILATMILNKDISLADGILAFGVLVFLQFLITFLSARFKFISRLIKSTPSLIAYKGELIKHVMVKERIDEDEVYAKIREKGLSSLSETEAIVLETDGQLTIIGKIKVPGSGVLSVLKHYPEK